MKSIKLIIRGLDFMSRSYLLCFSKSKTVLVGENVS